MGTSLTVSTSRETTRRSEASSSRPSRIRPQPDGEPRRARVRLEVRGLAGDPLHQQAVDPQQEVVDPVDGEFEARSDSAEYQAATSRIRVRPGAPCVRAARGASELERTSSVDSATGCRARRIERLVEAEHAVEERDLEDSADVRRRETTVICAALGRSRFTPPSITPRVIESTNVASDRSTISLLAPSSIAFVMASRSAGAVWRSACP